MTSVLVFERVHRAAIPSGSCLLVMSGHFAESACRFTPESGHELNNSRRPLYAKSRDQLAGAPADAPAESSCRSE
jgi:hypothetical protein